MHELAHLLEELDLEYQLCKQRWSTLNAGLPEVSQGPGAGPSALGGSGRQGGQLITPSSLRWKLSEAPTCAQQFVLEPEPFQK